MNKYRINKGFITQKMEGKTMIFDGEESVTYTLNNTASFIFERLKQGMGKDDVAELLVKRYAIPKEKAERDMKEFIEELRRRKIVS